MQKGAPHLRPHACTDLPQPEDQSRSSSRSKRYAEQTQGLARALASRLSQTLALFVNVSPFEIPSYRFVWKPGSLMCIMFDP